MSLDLPFMPDPYYFPVLSTSGFTQTSPRDKRYNCIGWAAGDNRNWWWPLPPSAAKWPRGVPRALTVEAFTAAFATLGYQVCERGEIEAGFEKIAIYALNGEVKHAARQLTNGAWTSKMGREADIRHTIVDGVCGPAYGLVARFMKRPRKTRG